MSKLSLIRVLRIASVTAERGSDIEADDVAVADVQPPEDLTHVRRSRLKYRS